MSKFKALHGDPFTLLHFEANLALADNVHYQLLGRSDRKVKLAENAEAQ